MKTSIFRFANYKSLFTATVCLFLWSCEVDDIPPPIESDGAASAKLNGKDWEAHVFRREVASKLSILIEKYGADVEYDASESISFYLVAKELDSLQKVYEIDSAYGTVAPSVSTKLYGSFGTSRVGNGDVTCDIFQVIEADTAHNWVRIEKQVDNFTEVWGSFEMKLYRKEGCNTSPYPDTLHVTDGRFYFSE